MVLWPLLLLPLVAPPAGKIVFDTDCGFFGDDGSALAMVVRSPGKVQVAAITAVSGNVWAAESAGYLTEILTLLGHSEMKPSVGAQMPLVHTPALAKLEGAIDFQGAFANPVKLTPRGAGYGDRCADRRYRSASRPDHHFGAGPHDQRGDVTSASPGSGDED